MRDDFPLSVKELLAKRVGYRCSNPSCRQPTSGPQEDFMKAINVGVAAHITAASIDGPRYDPRLTEERRSSQNGLWLCQTCAKLVDNDVNRYSVKVLRNWKQQAECTAARELEQRSESGHDQIFRKIEGLMPELLVEIRNDLVTRPLGREFVVLKRSWVYWAKGNELVYYYDDHPELDNKLQILLNYDLVSDTTYNDTKRYILSEQLVNYLRGGR